MIAVMNILNINYQNLKEVYLISQTFGHLNFIFL